ncbi:MAG: cupin domain-containing protein [Sphingobacteriales bacterium]|nr:MAG: cupin domain-containing protein [Sphingobacteriales bacterium]
MAYTDKIIFNQKTGQLIKFMQTSNDTDGKLLEMNVTFTPQRLPPPMHHHPKQTESFRIILGSLSVNIYGKTLILTQGQTLEIPANVPHSMWNNSDVKTIVNWRVKPALQTEFLLETLTGLANDDRTNSLGVPCLLQKVLTARKYNDSLRLSNPPYFIQRILFALITPLALLCGYRADDKKYFT